MSVDRPGLTFVGIGGERCGSTWYATMLAAHPEVSLARVKEVDFFSVHYERGWDWYRPYFEGAAGRAIGEVSPSYLYHPDAPRRIAESYPHAVVLCVLRDPFERALSHLLLIAQTEFGRISDIPVRTLFDLASSDSRFIDRSIYSVGLRGYLDRFPKERLWIREFSRIGTAPHHLVSSIYEALGVSTTFEPPGVRERINDAKDYRWHGAFKAIRVASRAARRFGGTRAALERLHRAGIRRRVMAFFEQERGRPDVAFDDVFSRRDRDRLEDEVSEIGELLGTSFTEGWAA